MLSLWTLKTKSLLRFIFSIRYSLVLQQICLIHFVFKDIIHNYILINKYFWLEEQIEENTPTYSMANADLKGLNKMLKIDYPGIFTIATCIVKYMGHRIVC